MKCSIITSILILASFIIQLNADNYRIVDFKSSTNIKFNPRPEETLISIYSLNDRVSVAFNGNRFLNVQQMIIPQYVKKIYMNSNLYYGSVLILYQDTTDGCVENSAPSLSQSIAIDKWTINLAYNNTCSNYGSKSWLLYKPIYPRNMIWAQENMKDIITQRTSVLKKWIDTKNNDDVYEITEFTSRKEQFNVLRRLNYHGFFLVKLQLKNGKYFYFPPLLLTQETVYEAPPGTNILVIGAIVCAGLFALMFHCYDGTHIIFSCWCILLTAYSYIMKISFFTQDNVQILRDKSLLWFFVIFYGIGPVFGFVCAVVLSMCTKVKSRARIIPTALCVGYLSTSFLYFVLALFNISSWILLLASSGVGVLVFGLMLSFNDFARSYGGVLLGFFIMSVGISEFVCEVSIFPYILIDLFSLIYSKRDSVYFSFIFVTINDLILILCFVTVTVMFGSISMGVSKKTKEKTDQIKPTQNRNEIELQNPIHNEPVPQSRTEIPVAVPSQSPSQYGAVHYHQEAVVVQINQQNVVAPSSSNAPGPSSQPTTSDPPRYSNIIASDNNRKQKPPSYDDQFGNATAPPLLI